MFALRALLFTALPDHSTPQLEGVNNECCGIKVMFAIEVLLFTTAA